MRWRRQEVVEVEQTPARHHLADPIESVVRADERVRSFHRRDDDAGPLGGIGDAITLTFEHEDRLTRAKIVIYGDTPDERVERFGA